MKVGELVRPNAGHLLQAYDRRSYGLVLYHCEKGETFAEHFIVVWRDGDVETELPVWLEVISESR